MNRARHDAGECAFVAGPDGLTTWSDLHAGAWLGLLQAHRHLTRDLDAALERSYGLTLSGLELLGRLAAADRRRLRLSTLAHETGLSLSRISRLASAFEARGLIEREECPEDARATNARLTSAGLRLAREAQAAHVRDVQRLYFDRLTAAERRVLARVFRRLTGAAQVTRMRVSHSRKRASVR